MLYQRNTESFFLCFKLSVCIAVRKDHRRHWGSRGRCCAARWHDAVLKNSRRSYVTPSRQMESWAELFHSVVFRSPATSCSGDVLCTFGCCLVQLRRCQTIVRPERVPKTFVKETIWIFLLVDLILITIIPPHGSQSETHLHTIVRFKTHDDETLKVPTSLWLTGTNKLWK